MVDCHIHMVLDGMYWKSDIARHADGADTAWIERVLSRYREAGFTYLRDGGDRWGAGKAARDMADRYGITYRTPLSPLSKAGHYGGFIGKQYADLKQYHTLVLENKRQGADFIKIMIAGLMDFDRFGVLTQPGLPEAEIAQLVHIAHSEGMAVMAHANGAETVLAAARAGVDSIEHGAYLNEEALHAMHDHGTVWVPTLSTIGNLRGKGRFSEPDVQKILETAMENVHTFAAMGGLVAPGSDAGAWAVPHGIATEHTLLRQAIGENAEAVLKKGTQTIIDRF